MSLDDHDSSRRARYRAHAVAFAPSSFLSRSPDAASTMRAASAPIRIPPRGRGGGGDDDDATDDRESRGSDETSSLDARVRAASTSPLPKRLRTRLELSSSRCGRHVASAETTRRRLDAAEKKRTVRARVFFFPLRVVKRVLFISHWFPYYHTTAFAL